VRALAVAMQSLKATQVKERAKSVARVQGAPSNAERLCLVLFMLLHSTHHSNERTLHIVELLASLYFWAFEMAGYVEFLCVFLLVR